MRVKRPYLVPDSIGQMRLAYSATSVDKKRIKRRKTGLLGNRHTCCTRQLVRLPGDKRIEGVQRIQLRVEMRYLLLVDHRARRRLGAYRRKHRPRTGGRINQHAVLQVCSLTENADNRRREQRDIVLLDILCYKLRFHLQHQYTALELQRHNRRKPCLVGAARQVVSQDGLTLSPLLLERLLHCLLFIYFFYKVSKI